MSYVVGLWQEGLVLLVVLLVQLFRGFGIPFARARGNSLNPPAGMVLTSQYRDERQVIHTVGQHSWHWHFQSPRFGQMWSDWTWVDPWPNFDKVRRNSIAR